MTLIFVRMVVHKRKNKWKRTIDFVFLFLVLLKEDRTRGDSKVSYFVLGINQGNYDLG